MKDHLKPIVKRVPMGGGGELICFNLPPRLAVKAGEGAAEKVCEAINQLRDEMIKECNK